MKKYLISFLLIAQTTFAFQIEHATTPEQRVKGLSERSSLPQDQGMLFYFDRPAPATIWMYRTLIDLSVAFLDDKGIVREIYELKSYPAVSDPNFFVRRSVTSTFNASYALEMNAHWFEKNGVKVGSRLVWQKNSPSAFFK